ncbi:hypothetical protein BDV12DRAFT_198933 [Aspergillus spectabilis]
MHLLRTLFLALTASIFTTTAAAPFSRRDLLAANARRAAAPQNDSAMCTQASDELFAILGLLQGEQFPAADEDILVSSPRPNWHVKLADFGIAKQTDRTALGMHFIESAGYLAPELHNDLSHDYTAAVELKNLGL